MSGYNHLNNFVLHGGTNGQSVPNFDIADFVAKQEDRFYRRNEYHRQLLKEAMEEKRRYHKDMSELAKSLPYMDSLELKDRDLMGMGSSLVGAVNKHYVDLMRKAQSQGRNYLTPEEISENKLLETKAKGFGKGMMNLEQYLAKAKAGEIHLDDKALGFLKYIKEYEAKIVNGDIVYERKRADGKVERVSLDDIANQMGSFEEVKRYNFSELFNKIGESVEHDTEESNNLKTFTTTKTSEVKREKMLSALKGLVEGDPVIWKSFALTYGLPTDINDFTEEDHKYMQSVFDKATDMQLSKKGKTNSVLTDFASVLKDRELKQKAYEFEKDLNYKYASLSQQKANSNSGNGDSVKQNFFVGDINKNGDIDLTFNDPDQEIYKTRNVTTSDGRVITDFTPSTFSMNKDGLLVANGSYIKRKTKDNKIKGNEKIEPTPISIRYNKSDTEKILRNSGLPADITYKKLKGYVNDRKQKQEIQSIKDDLSDF